LEDSKAQKGENMFELQIAAGAQGSFICIHEDNIIIICMPQKSIIKINIFNRKIKMKINRNSKKYQ